ncbi:hypothetical protein TYRP_021701, partial [Tyrophagus putrescentiae]
IAWKSKECPIDSQDNRDAFLCVRHCDYESSDTSPSRSQHSKGASKDNFFIVFFPPKGKEYEASRLKCPLGFKQVSENNQCFCERPLTPYELEAQRREHCDQAFERCRMYGTKPYDCNHIIDVCPPFGQWLTLTTIGHCERPPTRVPLAPLARHESVDVHSAQVSSDLAVLDFALLPPQQLCSPGSPGREQRQRIAASDSEN